MNEDKMREEFEKWAANHGNGLRINSGGDYVDEDTYYEWKAWKAAIESVQPEIKELKQIIKNLEWDLGGHDD